MNFSPVASYICIGDKLGLKDFTGCFVKIEYLKNIPKRLLF